MEQQNTLDLIKKKLQPIAINETFIACLSYFSGIGWILAFILQQKYHKNNSFTIFHIKQSLGLTFLSLVSFWIVVTIINLTSFYYLNIICVPVMSLTYVVIMICGMINTIKHNQKEIPLIGTIITQQLREVLNYNNIV